MPRIVGSTLQHVISIHAPVKGATIFGVLTAVIILISIHAPVKGATWASMCPSAMKTDFNPRSREGSDQWVSRVQQRTGVFQSTLP